MLATAALSVFAAAALVGVMLAARVLKGRLVPWRKSILHALLGGIGLALLIGAVLQGAEASRIGAALTMFLIAALGGSYLALTHFRGKIPSKTMVILHAGVAVAGFVTLLSAVLGM